jgi:glycogen debranching enzyme
MTWGMTAVAGATLVTGYLGSQATKSAAQTQADAAGRAQAQLLAAGQEAKEGYTPYTEAGKTALSDLAANKNYFQRQFNNQDLNATLAPGYDFRLRQGQQANMMANNASGGVVGGNALRSLQDYTQNFASGEYANAFNQFQTQRTNIYNQLSDIAKIGLTGQQGYGNAVLGTGTNIASITSGLGNAQAASQIAQGNILGNTVQGVANAGAYYAMNNNNANLAGNAAYNNNYTGYNANATGGGSFTPTQGNSFTVNPA